MDALVNVVVPVFGVVLTGYFAGRFQMPGSDSSAASQPLHLLFCAASRALCLYARTPVEKIFDWPFIGAFVAKQNNLPSLGKTAERPLPLVALRDICRGCTKPVGAGPKRTSPMIYEYAPQITGQPGNDVHFPLKRGKYFHTSDCVFGSGAEMFDPLLSAPYAMSEIKRL